MMNTMDYLENKLPTELVEMVMDYAVEDELDDLCRKLRNMPLKASEWVRFRLFGYASYTSEQEKRNIQVKMWKELAEMSDKYSKKQLNELCTRYGLPAKKRYGNKFMFIIHIFEMLN